MCDSSERRDGPDVGPTSLFCNAVVFLTDVKVGGYAAGLWVLFAALMVALTAHSYFDSYLPLYFFVAALLLGKIAYNFLCKRESLYGHLLDLGFRYAGLGISWWVANTYLDFPSFLGVLLFFAGPFIGEKAFALIRKVLRHE